MSLFYHCLVSMLRGVLIFTHISMYKYKKLVDPILCVKLFLRTHYAHICAYALLINEGTKSGVSDKGRRAVLVVL